MELDLPTPVSRPPSLVSSGEIDHQGGASTTLPQPRVFTHLNHGGQGGACTTLEVNHWSLIQGKEGGIQVLAGLAPSSQTVAFFKRDTGATFGGSFKTLGRL